VRFWLAKFQPVEVVPLQTNPLQIECLVDQPKSAPATMAFVKLGVGQRGGRKVWHR